ncbi:MAG: hypothetical protein LBT76_00045 [Tannerella sp.]|nr:hypothetical protein [Tannerella sp.]
MQRLDAPSRQTGLFRIFLRLGAPAMALRKLAQGVALQWTTPDGSAMPSIEG